MKPVNSQNMRSGKGIDPARKSARQDEGPSPQDVKTLVALFSQGRYAEAANLASAMTVKFPQHGFGWKALGAVFGQTGRIADALGPLQKAALLLAHEASVHNDLANALRMLGRLDEAVASFQRALLIRPDDAEVHIILGNIFFGRGQLGEAEASYQRALQLRQDHAEAHNNLGIVLKTLGRLGEAEASYRRALQSKPDYAEAHGNLGITLWEMNRLDEAAACYRRALQIKPDYVNALNSYALLLNAQGMSAMALNYIEQSLRSEETAEAKGIFVNCVKRLSLAHDDKALQTAMVRALTEPWDRPGDLAPICSELAKTSPDIGACIARAIDAWPERLPARDLFGSGGVASLAANRFLCALLNSAPVCDMGMERFLTMARRAMLDAAAAMTAADGEAGGDLPFYSALARQCFINEYVFAHTDEELRKAGDLRDLLVAALEAGTRVPALWPVALAAYFPLCTVPLAPRLLDAGFPETVTAVLAQQVREPAEERQLRSTIPQLTEIEDAVSLLVRSQYEENPYPRWVKAAPVWKTQSVVGYLSQKFPLSAFERQGPRGRIDILIAGCGTGLHSIEMAQHLQGAQVLAVDLSMSSLCYAKRKTRELGLSTIEYAQADLLKLESLERRFDLIDSTGVLHHLADPLAGWRTLLSLLLPGGFMRLGFYSEAARRHIVRIRSFIGEHGYGSTAEDIRRCRQDLLDLDQVESFGTTMKSPDFFSMSACRDLLFHVQEHLMTLGGIEAFLHDNHLLFLGFEIDSDVLHAYRQRFPDDLAGTRLDQWQAFENENPDTFLGMYQFWVQKVA